MLTAPLDAERSLLGAVLLDPSAFAEVSDLGAEAFADPRHREVFNAMKQLAAEGSPADPVLLEGKLEKAGTWRAVGGFSFISDLSQEVPTSHNIGYYADVVRTAAITRELKRGVQEVFGQGLEGEELRDELLRAILAPAAAKADNTKTIGEVVRGAIEIILQKLEGNKHVVATGIRELDAALGCGLQRGMVTILGGRPSMGKSALARTIADDASAKGCGVHYFSLEDRWVALGFRTIADHGRVELSRLHSPADLDRREAGAVTSSHERLSRRPWIVDDAAGLSSAQITSRVRRHKARNNTTLVVVDYVQLIAEKGAKDKRAEVETAAVSMQRLARDEDVAVLLLSQLNRGAAEREEPRLSDLRESGVLEQIAEAVLLLHRTEEKAQVIIAKNKNGRTGGVPMYWDGPTATYRALDWRRP